MRAQESFPFTFTSASATAAFSVVGGRYQLAAHAASWSSGSLDVQQLLPDNTTWATVPPNAGTHIAADGVQIYDLPPGQFRLSLATTAAAVAVLTRVPLE